MHDRADDFSTLADEVLRRRRELGLHQDELAALAAVSTRFVHSLEHGKPTVQLDKVLSVLRQLGLDLVLEPGGGTIRLHGEWPLLRRLAEAIGIPDSLAASAIREQITAAEIWVGELDELPFDGNILRNLRRFIRARMRHIQPE